MSLLFIAIWISVALYWWLGRSRQRGTFLFICVWTAAMAVQSIRCAIWAISEAKFGAKVAWLGAALVYLVLAYGSVLYGRALWRQNHDTAKKAK